MRKAGQVFDSVVRMLFLALMALVLFATVAIDKNKSAASNSVAFDNAAYFLVSALLLLFAWRRLYFRAGGGARLTGRGYYRALAALALAVAAVQLVISRWVAPLHEYNTADFTNIMNAGKALADGGSFESFPYFKVSPNNLNMAIVVSWVYGVFRSQWAVVFMGGLRTNLSVVLASLAVYNVTRRAGLSLTVAVVGELLVALTWRAFLVYTDNYAMIYVALMVWLSTTAVKPVLRTALITLAAVCGCFIKVTCAIVYLALAAAGLIRWMLSKDRGVDVKRAALAVGCAVALFAGMLGAQGALRGHYGYTRGEYPKGWQYMLMVGQNSEGMGKVSAASKQVREDYIRQYGNLRDINRAFIRHAVDSVKARGIAGNLAFFEKKINLVYNDGYFNNVQQKKMYASDANLLYNFYLKPGKYYQVGAALFQVLWDGILLVMMVYAAAQCRGAIRRRRRAQARRGADLDAAGGVLRFCEIMILGITLYLLLLEGRSKYLYMFMPVFLTAFGLMFDRLCRAALAARARRGAGTEGGIAGAETGGSDAFI